MTTRLNAIDTNGWKLTDLQTGYFHELHIFEDEKLKLAISKSEGEFVVYKEGVELTNDTLTRIAKEESARLRVALEDSAKREAQYKRAYETNLKALKQTEEELSKANRENSDLSNQCREITEKLFAQTEEANFWKDDAFKARERASLGKDPDADLPLFTACGFSPQTPVTLDEAIKMAYNILSKTTHNSVWIEKVIEKITKKTETKVTITSEDIVAEARDDAKQPK